MKREKWAGNTHDKITRRVRQKIKMGRNIPCLCEIQVILIQDKGFRVMSTWKSKRPSWDTVLDSQTRQNF